MRLRHTLYGLPASDVRPTAGLPAQLRTGRGLGVGLAGVLALGGCAHPPGGSGVSDLRTTIVRAHQRETATAAQWPAEQTTTRERSTLDFSSERLDELNRIGGPASYRGTELVLGQDLLAREPQTVRIGLQRAVASAVKNNLGVQRAELEPSINAAQTLAAQAAFDWVFFADFDWQINDVPGVVPVINGQTTGSGASQNQTVGYSAGFRKPLTTGGTFSAWQGHAYTDDSSPGVARHPDPYNDVFASIEYRQPLLRGFGSEVALAQVRLSQNAEQDAVLALKQQLIEVVTATETAYWDLLGARERLQIRRRLLERGIETRDVLAQRRQFDVRQSEYADAVATVERRRGDVIRAENELRLASDRLKRLINDPELSIGNEVLVLPTDDATDQPIGYSLVDAMTTALDHRPEVQRALLAIDDDAIRIALASNARLPLLDLAARATWYGLDRRADQAYEEIFKNDYFNWLLSLQFEQPLGNRAADAEYRAAQLRRLSTTVAYREVLQDVVLSVVTALRNMTTYYELIEQSHSSRLAAAENLRALLVQEETIATLSPEFLDLKLRRQEALAAAEINEVDAKLDYAIAIAEFQAAMGTTLERAGIEFVVPEDAEQRHEDWR